MMAKIHSGRNFAGLMEYANNLKEKNARIIDSEGVDLTSNKSIAASFSLQAKSRPSLKNFVGHTSLNFAPEDAPRLSDSLMAEIAREYRQRMGIVNTQYVVCCHFDRPHPHVHVVYNRVDNDGNALTGDQNFRKSAAITQALTREYRLTFGKGKKKVNRDRLKGKDFVKYRIYDTVQEELKHCRSMKSLQTALASWGVGMNIVRDAEGRPRGVVFTCENISFAGYRVDRSMTYAKLRQRMSVGQDTAGNAVGISPTDDRAPQPDLSFERPLSDTPGMADMAGEQRETEAGEALGGADAAGGGNAPGGGIGEAIAELIVQPHIAPTGGGGGGGSDDRGWNDEEKDKDKKNPYRRRR